MSTSAASPEARRRPARPIRLVEVADAHAVGRHPTALHHTFHHDPRVGPEATAALLSGDNDVEHHRGDLPWLLPRGEAPRLRATATEVHDGLADNGCWLIVWRAHRDPGLAAVLREVATDVGPAVVAADGPVQSRAMSVVASGPRARVPVHVDVYHLALLQVAGTKTVWVGQFDDTAVGDREAGRRVVSDAENPHEIPRAVARFDLAPGDGLYLPPYVPHWVLSGHEGVSRALSCTFTTASSERTGAALRMNARLRRVGLRPRPVGETPNADSVKAFALRLERAATRRIRGATSRRARAGSGSPP